MMRIDVVSTDGLNGRKKVEYWNDLAASAMAPMTADPTDVDTFRGRMRRLEIGEVRAVEVFSHGARVERSAVHIAHSCDTAFLLELQLDGASSTRQGGRDARLEPGDFTLLDSARPFEVRCTDPMRLLVLRVPRALLGKYLGCPESLAGIAMRAAQSANDLTSRFLRNLWDRPDAVFNSARTDHAVRAALELIANAYGALPAAHGHRTTAADAHRARVLDHIETHLCDPALNPTSIALALRMSPRYLHRVWTGANGESLARYILRQRLEECARALRDPLHARRRITAIAFDSGFAGMPHFCAAFRAHFGVAPREYRSSAAGR